MIESETGECWGKVFVIGDEAVDRFSSVEWPPEADLRPQGTVEGNEPGWRSVIFSVAVPVVIEDRPLIVWFVAYQLGSFGATTDEIRRAVQGFDALLITHKDDGSRSTERATTLIRQITQAHHPCRDFNKCRPDSCDSTLTRKRRDHQASRHR